eukprot:GEMP01092741.1.p1 GENE.GEMP01092741.1~~GEMP01092741.1.p1  ORF type:complete len:215 (+),score=0.74 GEMP01092741.1:114-758(+)
MMVDVDTEMPFYEALALSIRSPETFTLVMRSMSDDAAEKAFRLFLVMLRDIPKLSTPKAQIRLLSQVQVHQWALIWPSLKGLDNEKVSAILDLPDPPRILCSLLEHKIIGFEPILEELPRYVANSGFMVGTCLAGFHYYATKDEWWELVDEILRPPNNFHIFLSTISKLYDREIVSGSNASHKVINAYLADDQNDVYLKALQSLSIVGLNGTPL